MKIFLYGISILIVLSLFGVWFIFYKGEPVKDAMMITMCLDKSKLHITTAESAKVFTLCKSEVAGDTLKVFIETALVNTFVKRPLVSGEFEITPQIKYITIANKITQVSALTSCAVIDGRQRP